MFILFLLQLKTRARQPYYTLAAASTLAAAAAGVLRSETTTTTTADASQNTIDYLCFELLLLFATTEHTQLLLAGWLHAKHVSQATRSLRSCHRVVVVAVAAASRSLVSAAAATSTSAAPTTTTTTALPTHTIGRLTFILQRPPSFMDAERVSLTQLLRSHTNTRSIELHRARLTSQAD